MILSGMVNAHSGGTDSNGCHTNHKTGVYHCH
ncbi:YHYH domain-containing protein [Photobacterium piscicola]|nr:YHYH domain-containing protein [Photobacterium piscicola]